MKEGGSYRRSALTGGRKQKYAGCKGATTHRAARRAGAGAVGALLPCRRILEGLFRPDRDPQNKIKKSATTITLMLPVGSSEGSAGPPLLDAKGTEHLPSFGQLEWRSAKVLTPSVSQEDWSLSVN